MEILPYSLPAGTLIKFHQALVIDHILLFSLPIVENRDIRGLTRP